MMVTLFNIRTKKKLQKTKSDADIILNNKLTGKDWKVLAETPEAAAPPEVIKKVSIREETQEVNPKKPTKKNNAD